MQIIKLDSSSHVGYEMRHAALHGARRHGEAVEAFDGMLSKVASSPNVEFVVSHFISILDHRMLTNIDDRTS